MKNILTAFLILSMGLFVSSCGEDTCDVLSETVVGTWTIEASGPGTVTIDADGTFTQTDNLVFDSTFDNGTKTWTVSGSTISLISTENNISNIFDFEASTFDCETITTTNTGNTFVFRKQ